MRLVTTAPAELPSAPGGRPGLRSKQSRRPAPLHPPLKRASGVHPLGPLIEQPLAIPAHDRTTLSERTRAVHRHGYVHKHTALGAERRGEMGVADGKAADGSAYGHGAAQIVRPRRAS